MNHINGICMLFPCKHLFCFSIRYSLFTAIHINEQWALFRLYHCIITNSKFIVFGLSLVVRGSWFSVFGSWIKFLEFWSSKFLVGDTYLYPLSLSKSSRIFTHEHIKDDFSLNIQWKCDSMFPFFPFLVPSDGTQNDTIFFFYVLCWKRSLFTLLLASVLLVQWKLNQAPPLHRYVFRDVLSSEYKIIIRFCSWYSAIHLALSEFFLNLFNFQNIFLFSFCSFWVGNLTKLVLQYAT